MNKSYWTQRASTWVSAAVLAGGLATAVLLVFLVKMETQLENFVSVEEIAAELRY